MGQALRSRSVGADKGPVGFNAATLVFSLWHTGAAADEIPPMEYVLGQYSSALARVPSLSKEVFYSRYCSLTLLMPEQTSRVAYQASRQNPVRCSAERGSFVRCLRL